MNFVPYKIKNIFIRNENDEMVTLYSKNSGLKFLNSVSSYIFENINGINTFEDIINKMKTLYPTVNETTLTNDTLDCLHSLKTMKFINWKDESEMGENSSVSSLSFEVAGEQDYSSISKYILRNFKNTVNDNYLINIPIGNKSYYTDIAIRTRQFNLNEIYFMTKNNNQITSLVSVVGFDSTVQTVSIGVVICEKNNVKDLEFNLLRVEEILKENKNKKIKLNLFADNCNDKIIDLFSDIGYELEASLEKEINGLDLLVYKKILDKEM